MKLGAIRHPKTGALRARLGAKLPTALGYLELLWAFAAEFAPQGNVGKYEDGAIASACEWEGDPAAFVEALVGTGFLDPDTEHRLVIHDWEDHAPGWVRAKLSKLKKVFLKAGEAPSEPSSDGSSEATSEPSPRARVSTPREGKTTARPRDGKGREAKATGEPPSDRTDYHESFERAKAEYPTGTYRGSAWLIGQRNFYRIVDDGLATASDLVDAATAYAAQQTALGKIGTQFVLSPATFFDPGLGHWRGPFPMPRDKAQVRQDTDVAAAERWLRGGANA